MLRVLLVDDEMIIIQGMKKIVDWESAGFEIVATASNGIQAFEYLKTNEVDLIITDIKMPLMTGIEFLEKICREKISNAHFVILSGYGEFQYAQKAIRYECTDYILKPIRQEELESLLKKIRSIYEKNQTETAKNHQGEKAYLARNVISLLSGKYDQNNVEYVEKHLHLSAEMRYIAFEVDISNKNKNATDSDIRKLQRKLYFKCMEIIGEKFSNHCIFDVSADKEGYDVGIIYSHIMTLEQGREEQDYLNWLMETLQKSIDIPIMMYVGSMVDNILKIEESYRTAIIVKTFKNFSTGSGMLLEIEKKVKEHCTDNLTLKELGRKYYINSAYLGQIFRKKYGMNFKDYLNKCRMEKAAYLLVHTDMRVYEIAETVGIKSMNYFINRFIEAMGYTPTAYRKRSQGGGP